MRILALDLATKTGWAVLYENGVVVSGVQDFSLKRGESPGMLFVHFVTWLGGVISTTLPEVVVYEQAHHRGGAPTRIGVGLVTHMEGVCSLAEVEYTPCHSATLKKHATGKGRGSKDDMLAAAEKQWPGVKWIDDNHVDAAWLLDWAYQNIAGGRGHVRVMAA